MGSKDKKQEKNQNIHVAVRCRPLSLQEKKQGSHSIASINNEKREVYMKERANTKTFTFDQVFGPEAEQVDIYKSVVMPVVEEVLMGYNCTMFAYGQTGSGKTYTMEGERTAEQHISWDKDPLAGIIPRSVHQIFDTLTKQDVEFSMRVSFLELYNEELFDLLSSSDNGLRMRIFEDSAKKGSVVIQGLEEIAVMNKDEVYNIMERGAMKRQTAATLMNACSSRSHSVFSITIHIKENTVDGEELLKTGKLNLVDLAGSENIGRSGAIDKRAREAGNINQSLLSLGRVITALVERAPHVPYRESKLTRLLQDSLGGRTKTSIIATISPASFNLDETLSTLDYAHRAKNIQNRPEINQKLTKRTLIKEYTEEIEKLRKDLIAAREKNGIYLAEENYMDITSRLETQAAVIKELEDNIGALTDEITKVSEIFTETQSKLDETTKTLDYTTDQLCSTQHELHTTKRDRDEQKHLVGHHVRSERALYSQAKKLLTTSDESTADVSGLHSKLDRKHKVERHNLDTQTNFQNRFSDDITNMAARLSSFAQQQREMSHAVQENIGQTLTAHKERLEVFVQYLGKLSCSVEEGHDNLTTLRMDQLASNTAWTEEKLSYVRDTCRDASKSVSQRCHEQLQPNLCNIEQQLAQLKQHIADLSGYVKQQATTQQEMVQDFVKGQMAGLESIVVSVSAYAKDRETSVNALEQKVEEMTKANDSLQPIASLLMKTINEQSQTYKQVGEELAESSRVDSEFFNVRWPTYTQQCHATEVQFSESYASALKTAAEGVGEKIEMMKSAEQIAETKSSEGQECVSALEHDSTQRWTDMNTSLTSSVDALKKDLNAQTNKLNGCSEASVKEVARGKERLEGALTQHLSEHCQQVAAQMQNEVSLQVALLDQTESNVQQELEMRKEQLDTFLADELKVDIPTGTTPQRRDFAYPRTLSRTQPHDQLLQTYRASVDVSDAMNVSQARVLPLPEDTFVEEEDQENVNQQSLDKTGNSSNLDVSDNILACKSHHTNAARTSKLPLRNNN